MDRNPADDLNDPMRDERMRERGLDRTGAPDSTASSESLMGDSMRAGAPRGDDTIDVDRADRELRRDDVNPGDEIGEAVGGISGVLTGAALGSLGGPVGTIIGGIAGAVSGWWAGRAISEAASHATGDDDEYYRTHYDTARGGKATRDFDTVRPAYQIGHLAGRNPDYQSRSFDEVEGDLRHGWTSDVSRQHGDWNEVRDYARHAYDRGRTTGSSTTGGSYGANAAMGGTGAAIGGGVGDALTRGARGVGNAMDDTKDRVDGNPASRPGADATDSASRTGGMNAGGMGGSGLAASGLGSSSMGGSSMGGSLGNTADDMKDRIDGNPGSRPGLDATDSMHRANPMGTTGDRVENTADRAGNALGRAWDNTKDAAHRAGEKVEDALDDTKDRVDGNPSTRPGVDRTDDRDRRY